MSDDVAFFIDLTLNGASIGLMYSLIALGFVLVYKATDAINFAQGEFVMMAGLIAAALLAVEGMPLVAALVATLAIMVAFGFGLEKVVLRPLLGRPVVAVIMATIGLAAMLRGLNQAKGLLFPHDDPKEDSTSPSGADPLPKAEVAGEPRPEPRPLPEGLQEISIKSNTYEMSVDGCCSAGGSALRRRTPRRQRA